MRFPWVLVVLAVLIGMSACGAEPTPDEIFVSEVATPTSPPVASATMNAQSTAPMPGASPQHDTRATVPALLSPLPTLAPDKGGVVGQFIDHVFDKPVAETTFYLGELLSPTEGEDADSPFVMMVPSTSPSFTTDENGRFAILDVKPATYAVVFWTPRGSHVVTNLETDESVLVTIGAGEIIDLDVVRIEAPN